MDILTSLAKLVMTLDITKDLLFHATGQFLPITTCNHPLQLKHTVSVTIMGDLFAFGQLLKLLSTIFLAQIVHIFGPIVKVFPFPRESIFGQLFIDIGRLFTRAFWSLFLHCPTVRG